jgi:hypothetical protein
VTGAVISRTIFNHRRKEQKAGLPDRPLCIERLVLPASTELDATVALDHPAGDEAAAGDEGDGNGNILGLPDPADRRAGGQTEPGKGPGTVPAQGQDGMVEGVGPGAGDMDLDPGLDIDIWLDIWSALILWYRLPLRVRKRG